MRFGGNVRDRAGQQYGRLTVVAPVGRSADGHVIWRCRCDCGKETTAQSNSLGRASGKSSCGCARSAAAARRVNRDGAWNNGKSYAINSGARCYKTRHAWAKAVIRFYGNKCERCGWNQARCDAHHRRAKARGGLHTIKNGIVLCPNCHRIEHERKR